MSKEKGLELFTITQSGQAKKVYLVAASNLDEAMKAIADDNSEKILDKQVATSWFEGLSLSSYTKKGREFRLTNEGTRAVDAFER